MNSPNNVSAADSSPNYNEKRNSLADSNISNVSIGSASSMNNSGKQISPSISIGEEALKTSPGVQADNRNSSKNNSSSSSLYCKITFIQKEKIMCKLIHEKLTPPYLTSAHHYTALWCVWTNFRPNYCTSHKPTKPEFIDIHKHFA